MINETVASGVNLGAIVENPNSFTPSQDSISSNITLTDLVINGIFLNNLEIANQYAWGVGLFYCNDVNVYNVLVTQLTHSGLVINAPVTCVGIGMNFCTNVICRSCTSNNLYANSSDYEGSAVGDALGALYLLCNRTENYDCSYNKNIGTRRGGGLVWVGSNNFVAMRCVADSNNVIDQTNPTIQSHYGFEAVGIPSIGIPSPFNGVIKDATSSINPSLITFSPRSMSW